MIYCVLAQFKLFFFFDLVPISSISPLVPAWLTFTKPTRAPSEILSVSWTGKEIRGPIPPMVLFCKFRRDFLCFFVLVFFFLSPFFKCRGRVMRLFLSNSSTNWVFCIVVLYLAITVKVNKFR